MPDPPLTTRRAFSGLTALLDSPGTLDRVDEGAVVPGEDVRIDDHERPSELLHAPAPEPVECCLFGLEMPSAVVLDGNHLVVDS